MILDRYLTSEIAKPMMLGVGLLVIIFAGYSSGAKLTEAAEGALPASTVGRLIFLNTLIALEVLLPTALYLSVISALGRLYRDSEMTAMNASGISESRILIAVLKFATLIAIVVAALSLFGRPWAYRESYRLESDAAAEIDMNKIEPGQFLQLREESYVLFAKSMDRKRGRLKDVFLQSDAEGKSKAIYAREATIKSTKPDAPRTVEFYNGYAYVLDHTGSKDVVLKFKTLTLHLQAEQESETYRRKAENTLVLAQSRVPKEIAEYQWRLSTPFATILLAMLSVPLSRSTPRQSRYMGFVYAILAYVVLFNLASMARNWLEQDKIGAFPGLWWVYVLAFIAFLILFYLPNMRRS